MPVPVIKTPKTDPEWDSVSDERLASMTGQRASSERAARAAYRELHAKVNELNGRSGCGLALNLADLSRARPEVRGPLLKDKLNLREPVRPDPRDPLEVAVQFTCDLATAAAATDVLREHDRAAGDRPTRAYLRCERAGRTWWVRLSASAVLSTVVGGRTCPNPHVFRPDVRPADLVAPPVRTVRM